MLFLQLCTEIRREGMKDVGKSGTGKSAVGGARLDMELESCGETNEYVHILVLRNHVKERVKSSRLGQSKYLYFN